MDCHLWLAKLYYVYPLFCFYTSNKHFLSYKVKNGKFCRIYDIFLTSGIHEVRAGDVWFLKNTVFFTLGHSAGKLSSYLGFNIFQNILWPLGLEILEHNLMWKLLLKYFIFHGHLEGTPNIFFTAFFCFFKMHRF